MACIFCDIVKKKIAANIIYESNTICCFLDIDPINEGHVLIIPKQHYLDIDEIPDSILFDITALSKNIVAAIKRKYVPDGYSIMQNGGDFNDIGHYHLHVFPRYSGDGFGWTSGKNIFECNESVSEEIKKLLIAIS